MKKFFTIGPSQLYPTVKSHIYQALEDDVTSISHRSEDFRKIYKEAVKGIKDLMRIPDNYQVLFYSSATECMERIVHNCVFESSYHFICGAFSKRFQKVSEGFGKKANYQQVFLENQEWFDFDFAKKEILKSSPELLAFTANETSTGVTLDLKKTSQLKLASPQSLVAIDGVSIFPLIELEWEYIDLGFFSTQKIFGMPAGLGILIISPQAIKKSQKVQAKKNYYTGAYFNFEMMLDQNNKSQTPQTPNVLGIYLLSKVSHDFIKKGLDQIVEKNKNKAQKIYNYFDTHDYLKPLVKNKKLRSETTIVIQTSFDSKNLINFLKSKDIIVSSGYGQDENKQIRIANFPATSEEDVDFLIESISDFVH